MIEIPLSQGFIFVHVKFCPTSTYSAQTDSTVSMVSRYKSFYIYYSIDRDLTTNNKKTQNQPSKNCSDLKLLADQSKTSESWSIFRGQLNANKMFRVISSTYNCFLNDCFKFVSATEEGLRNSSFTLRQFCFFVICFFFLLITLPQKRSRVMLINQFTFQDLTH